MSLSAASTVDDMRTFFLWVTGILACGIVGMLVGAAISPYSDGGFFGFFAGVLGFTCLRLWIVPGQNSSA